jgi:uncharacterized protein YcbK (DUF882 family)
MKNGPPPSNRRRRRRSGSSPRTSRGRFLLDVLFGVAAGLMVSAWTATIVMAYRERPGDAGPPVGAAPAPVSRAVSASLTDPRAKSTAYLEEVALNGFVGPLKGRSGKLRAVFRTPQEAVADGEDPHFTALDEESGAEVARGSAPEDPGIYRMAVELGKVRHPLEDLSLITLVPFSRKTNERIGLYYLGSWPYEKGGRPRSASYGNPEGFIEVTRENRRTPVSDHFELDDFLTKDQFDVWPKYVLIEPKLLDKLELTIQELEDSGHRVDHVFVMSGFRTPRYNKGGGNTAGRANLSRHMYGDGADVYVDNDRDGQPDDLNGDGRVDTADARVFGDAAARVEAKHPVLVGGIGIYKACCGHGPFTHIDTRGYRARWNGEGTG